MESRCFSVLTEGVELLCLIDKGLDACRDLQTYGHWEEAVWLSKVRCSCSCVLHCIYYDITSCSLSYLLIDIFVIGRSDFF